MENTKITSHKELVLQLALLKAEKTKQEDELKITLNNLVGSLSPISIIKRTLSGLANDKEVRFSLAKIGMNLGSSLFINKMIGKYSIVGSVGSLLAGKISPSLIKTKFSQLTSAISKMVKKNGKQETNPE
ncbi:MAG: hypothetical protein H0X62_12715 [Bacteroidetes bacterium]|nr:hypothetical protein [Bacteroidota bacterium]